MVKYFGWDKHKHCKMGYSFKKRRIVQLSTRMKTMSELCCYEAFAVWITQGVKAYHIKCLYNIVVKHIQVFRSKTELQIFIRFTVKRWSSILLCSHSRNVMCQKSFSVSPYPNFPRTVMQHHETHRKWHWLLMACTYSLWLTAIYHL